MAEPYSELQAALKARLHKSCGKYLADCDKLGFEPMFSDGRPVITSVMAAQMACPWPPENDL